MATASLPKAPLWMQNVDYPASWDRVFADVLFNVEGVIAGFAVSPGGGLYLTVTAGQAVIQGDEVANQGKYLVDSDASVALLLDAVGVERTEYVYLAVNDEAVAGGRTGNNVTVETGASVPANSAILIATVVLPAGTSTITNAMITDNRSFANAVADGSVTAAKIAAGAVGTAALADGAVTEAKIADNQVTTSKLVDGSVTNTKLATDSVSTAKIQANAVTTAKIADGQITTAKIADLAVTAAKIANATITGSKVVNGTIGTAQLADGAVTTAKIANAQVTNAKLANDAVTAAKIADGQVTNAKITDDTITGAKIAPNTITAANIGADAVGASELANNSVAAANIIDGAVTTDKIDPSAFPWTTTTNGPWAPYRWTKIGRTVHIQGDFDIGVALTGTSAATITTSARPAVAVSLPMVSGGGSSGRLIINTNGSATWDVSDPSKTYSFAGSYMAAA